MCDRLKNNIFETDEAKDGSEYERYNYFVHFFVEEERFLNGTIMLGSTQKKLVFGGGKEGI